MGDSSDGKKSHKCVACRCGRCVRIIEDFSVLKMNKAHGCCLRRSGYKKEREKTRAADIPGREMSERDEIFILQELTSQPLFLSKLHGSTMIS
jgi:hypothetical protein